MMNPTEDCSVGVLILNRHGAIIFANPLAQRLCYALAHGSTAKASPPDEHYPRLIPHPIWRSCQAVIESRDLFPNQPIVIEDEIKVDDQVAVQLQARWLDLDGAECFYLLVMLEEHALSQTAEKSYGLTQTETAVWLLWQAGYSNSAIAAQLNISAEAVQRHLDHIQTKQRIAELLDE